jgi:hypothetical protein
MSRKIKLGNQEYNLGTQSTSRSAAHDQSPNNIIDKMRASKSKTQITLGNTKPGNQINNIIININNNLPTQNDQTNKDIRVEINNNNVKLDVKDNITDEVLETNQKRMFIRLSRLVSSKKCRYLYILALVYCLTILICSVASLALDTKFVWLYGINLLGLVFILLDVMVRIYLYVRIFFNISLVNILAHCHSI